MRRVLMVTPHFPPDSSAASHRVRLLAPHLEDAGWSPTVVTVERSAYEGRLDPDLEALVPASLKVERARAWPADVTRLAGLGDLGLRAFVGLRRACRTLLLRERYDALFITVYPVYPALLGATLKREFGVPFVLDYQDPWVGAWGQLRRRRCGRPARLEEPRVASTRDVARTAGGERRGRDCRRLSRHDRRNRRTHSRRGPCSARRHPARFRA